jgi:hypothetical protein
MNFIFSIDWLIKRMPFIFEANAKQMIEQYDGFGTASISHRFNSDVLTPWSLDRLKILRLPPREFGVTIEQFISGADARYLKAQVTAWEAGILERPSDSLMSFNLLPLTDLIIYDLFSNRYIIIAHRGEQLKRYHLDQ